MKHTTFEIIKFIQDAGLRFGNYECDFHNNMMDIKIEMGLGNINIKIERQAISKEEHKLIGDEINESMKKLKEIT